MDKITYLKILKDSLSGKIKDNELEDIISDYESFFATGVEEGKTEDQISEELGKPQDIASSLTESQDSVTLVYAPLYKRIPALLIDIIFAGLPFIWFAPHTAAGLYFMPQVLYNLTPSLLSTVRVSNHLWISQYRLLWVAAIFASVIWFLLVNPLCLFVFKGYTIGKRIMNIKVVTVEGSDIRLIQALVRELFGKYALNFIGSLLPSVLALLPSIFSLIWAALSGTHKTLHDAIARTCVIEGKNSGKRQK